MPRTPTLCRTTMLLFVALSLLLVHPAAPFAATCNSSKKQCACGDTLTESRTLDQDLEGCGGVGLRLRSGVTLDCNGHAIRGRSSREGILLQGIDGARVRNCEVSGFRFGIRVRAGRSHLISANHVVDNRRGISVGEMAEDTRLESNQVTGNRDLGVLVNPGTNRIHLYDNTISGNGKRNLDIRASIDLVLDRNLVGGRTKYDMRFMNVKEALLRSNQFTGGRIQIRGDSDRNKFLDNQLLSRNGFDFRGEEDRDDNFSGPDYNEIRGGAILAARRCFRFAGASYNVVEDVVFGACAGRPVDYRTVDGHEPIGNVVQGVASQNVSAEGSCGGDVACSCGDTARGSVRLSEDLMNCDRIGLRLESGTTLDCGGHAIIGRQSDDGLRIQSGEDIRIRNCRIENFETGVRIGSSKSILLTDNTFTLNRTAIRVNGSSEDIAVERNLIEQSRDQGILVSDGVTGMKVVRNHLHTTRKTHIEINTTQDVLIDKNVLEGDARTAIKLVDAPNNSIRSNEIFEGSIELRGSSTGNRFLDNILVEDGFRFEGIEERSGPWRFPDGNHVKGGEILEARRCFYIRGASNNIFDRVELGECKNRPFELKSADGHEPTGNLLLD